MKQPEVITISVQELDALLSRLRSGQLVEADYQIIESMAHTIKYLGTLLEQKNMSIKRLRRLVFGAKTEKTAKLLKDHEGGDSCPDGEAAASTPKEESGSEAASKSEGKPRKGHGRNGTDSYSGAHKVTVEHPSLKAGDPCLLCPKGKVYPVKTPMKLIRIEGQAPLQATVYELARFRCNGCGALFTASPPKEAGTEKYSPSASSIVSLSRYGSGLPFNRLEALQANVGVPLPASTQWEIVEKKADRVQAVYRELVRQAAQGEVFHNDDTGMRILELMKEQGSDEEDQEDEEHVRRGLFTTGIISVLDDEHTIALFYTGAKHAGENLLDLLQQREASLAPPIQMCDALARNRAKGVTVRAGSCLVHARRQVAEIVDEFPEPCETVLQVFKEVFKAEAEAKEGNLSPEDRLRFHQSVSGPLMDGLKGWIETQFAEKAVEPNSNLGKALKYITRHWEKLTLFLREPKAPLENNIAERVLKRAILHRKNSLFYKTLHGAYIGDLFMSLIHTCHLCRANAFDYLNQIDIHSALIRNHPDRWMPWNYRLQLEGQEPYAAPA